VDRHLDLRAQGLRLFAGRLYNHDYLWFSSVEISKSAATLPLIHNYALSYAVSGYSYGLYRGASPRYAEDLRRMPAYATPARPESPVAYTRFTQNAINSRTLRTDDAPRGTNSPALGWRVVIDPVWRNNARSSGHEGFSFYVFARDSFRPPSVTRLGKKGCPVRLEWEEIPHPVAVLKDEPVRPTHAVSPLDVRGKILVYDPVAIPPFLILRSADIAQDWFVLSGEHRVHIPRRFVGDGETPVPGPV
jgi:CRISPR-associated protein Csc1